MRTLGLVFAMALSHFLVAQGYIDLAKVEYLYGLSGNNYDDYQSLRITAQAPIVLGNGDVIPTGFAIGGYKLALEDTRFQPRNLRINVGYRRKINEEKSLTLMTIHRLNGDSFEFDTDHYQFGLIGLFTYRDKPGPMLQFGFYTNTEFVGQFFTPLFGLDWEINDKVRFFGVLPINGTLQVKLKDRFAYGVNFQGVFASYRLQGRGEVYLQENFNQVSLYTDLGLTQELLLNVKAGCRIGSNNRLYRNGDKMDLALNLVKIGDDRTELDQISTDGLIISAALIFRYQIPPPE